MTRSIPWPRILAEGAAIVVSILLAFGIQAWWEGVQERAEEQQLIADLTEEFEGNRDRLREVTRVHRDRAPLFATLIREAGPDRLGLSSDSLRRLADELSLNLAFSEDRGVVTRAQSGNGLSVLSDQDLRARVAGFWDSYQSYFDNQMLPVQNVLSSDVLWATGSLVRRDIPRWESMGTSTMWSDPLTPDEVNAVKYWAYKQTVERVLVTQGERMLVAMDTVLAALQAAQAR